MEDRTPQEMIEAELRKRAAAQRAAAKKEAADEEQGRQLHEENLKLLPPIAATIRRMGLETASTLLEHGATPNARLYLPETQRVSVRRPGLLGNLGFTMKETAPSDKTMPVWIVKHVARYYEYTDSYGQEYWKASSYHHSGFALTRDGEIVTYTAPDYGSLQLPDSLRMTMEHVADDSQLIHHIGMLVPNRTEGSEAPVLDMWRTWLTESALKNIPSGS